MSEPVIYSASSLGFCPAAMFLDRLGITGEPTPDFMQEKYDEGTHNEPIILDMLEDQKVWQVVDKEEWLEMGFEPGEYMPERDKDYSDQIRVRANIGANITVQAHLDGLVRLVNVPPGWDQSRLGELRVAEAKAFGKTYWEQFQKGGLAKFPKYEWQLSAQMKGAGTVWPDIPALFVVGRKGESIDCVEVDTQLVDEPPIGWGTVARKLLDIEKRINEGGGVERIPPCHKPYDYPCPFYKFHEEKGEVATPDDAMLVALLDSLAEQYETARLAIKPLEEKRKAASKGLVDFFASQQASGEMPSGKLSPEPVSGEQWVIKLVEQEKSAPGLDEERMKADGIDVEKYRTEVKYMVRYPNVTKKGKG